MKSLEKLAKAIDKYAERYMNRLAYTIAAKAQINFDRNKYNITGTPAEIDVIVSYGVEDEKNAYVVAAGPKVAFIEFGTGRFNQPYNFTYIQQNADITIHGTYGKHKGRQRAWGYYAKGTLGSIQLGGNDFINEKQWQKPVITFGMNPAHALFNAIKDAKKEVRSKK